MKDLCTLCGVLFFSSGFLLFFTSVWFLENVRHNLYSRIHHFTYFADSYKFLHDVDNMPACILEWSRRSLLKFSIGLRRVGEVIVILTYPVQDCRLLTWFYTGQSKAPTFNGNSVAFTVVSCNMGQFSTPLFDPTCYKFFHWSSTSRLHCLSSIRKFSCATSP